MKTHDGGHDDNGPAWISRVTFSKTGKTMYWRGKKLQRGVRVCGNHFDVETGEDYWVSGPKKNGEDRYPWAGEKVRIDPDVRQEYWTEIRDEPERADEELSQCWTEQKMTKAISKAIDDENWPRARRLIKGALKHRPDDHWLLTRLGLTYYEQRRYKLALFYTKKALALCPHCSLVLWDYAGCLDMLGQRRDAIIVYQRLIRRGIARLAIGNCGEGHAWARGLVADCHYRIARCYRSLGEMKRAGAAYRRHLALRGPGCRSIYQIRKARKELQSLGEGK